MCNAAFSCPFRTFVHRHVAACWRLMWWQLLAGRHSASVYSSPQDWPLPARTQVWVCTSTSGAAPMTREERLAPWQQLSDRLQALDWPPVARCSQDL